MEAQATEIISPGEAREVLKRLLQRGDLSPDLLKLILDEVRLETKAETYAVLSLALDDEKQGELVGKLRARFLSNENRHPGITWEDVERSLQSNFQVLQTLYEMERSGGEPDVFRADDENYLFVDWSIQVPDQRKGLNWHQAKSLAAQWGADLMLVSIYRRMQEISPLDSGDSKSWLMTETGNQAFGSRTNIVETNVSPTFMSPLRGFRTSVKIPKAN